LFPEFTADTETDAKWRDESCFADTVLANSSTQPVILDSTEKCTRNYSRHSQENEHNGGFIACHYHLKTKKNSTDVATAL